MSCTLPTIGELRARLRPAVAATGIADPLEAARKANTSLVFNYDRHSVELDESDLRAIRDGYAGDEHVIGRRDFWRLGREFAGLDRVAIQLDADEARDLVEVLNRPAKPAPALVAAIKASQKEALGLKGMPPLEQYVALLDELLSRRAIQDLDEEEEERFSVALNDCRSAMAPEDEARLEQVVADRRVALAAKLDGG